MKNLLRVLGGTIGLALPGGAQAQRGGFGGGRGGMGGGMGDMGGRGQFSTPDLPGPELDGPPDSASARRLLDLKDDQAGKYAQAYDSFMVATRPRRDSAQTQLDIMRQKLDNGDRAAAMFYAERVQRLGKELKDRQGKFEDQLFKTLSADQIK